MQAAALLVALGVAAWALLAGPVLAVQRVRVDGVSGVVADEVRRVAAVPIGTPLPWVDLDAARARVARVPQVGSVQVARGWPHAVVITVVARVPVAVVERAGTKTLVDRHGVLFDTITGDPPPGVVPIDVPHPGPGNPATAAALAAVTALPRDLRGQVAGVSARTGEDVTLTLTDGTTVRWGDGGDAAKKASVLGALLQQMRAGHLGGAHIVDVSTPAKVVLR